MTIDAMVRVDRPVDDWEEDTNLLIVQRLDYYICLIDTQLEMSKINAQVSP